MVSGLLHVLIPTTHNVQYCICMSIYTYGLTTTAKQVFRDFLAMDASIWLALLLHWLLSTISGARPEGV